MNKIALTGVKPTGTPHIGNYFGAIKPAIELSKNEELDSFYFIADYHALNFIKKKDDLIQFTKEIACTWLACGLDPNKIVFYKQSDVPEVTELNWLLCNVTSKGLMNRAHAYKALVEKSVEAGDDPDALVNMGLFNYPILMAADILLFNTKFVPVGADQKQHVEMARDIAKAFNKRYGNTFVIPTELIQESVATITGIDGRKMSKSLGNGVDPLEVSEKYGADALRIALIKDMALGLDSRFSMTKVENARAFINKIWNASKFISLHSKDIKLLSIKEVKKETKDKWILTKLSNIIKTVTNNLEKFDVGMALSNIYNFAWNEFCDWYIELCKPAIYKGGEDKQNTVSILSYVFDNILKLLHPFIPFVTEYIYQNLDVAENKSESIMISTFPTVFSVSSYKEEFSKQDKTIESIKLIRNAKNEAKIASNVKSDMYYENIAALGSNASEIEKLALVNLTNEKGEGKVVYTPLGEFVLLDEKKDKEEIIKELEEEIKRVQFEVDRSEKMLSNPRFVEKAPAALVETEKAKLETNQKTLLTLNTKLNSLK